MRALVFGNRKRNVALRENKSNPGKARGRMNGVPCPERLMFSRFPDYFFVVVGSAPKDSSVWGGNVKSEASYLDTG